MRSGLTRREFTRNALTTTLCAASVLGGQEKAHARSDAEPITHKNPGQLGMDTLDAALEALARRGPEYGGGLSNHGPMACEALIALSRPEAVMPWLEQYQRRLQGPPDERKRIERNSWREALGRMERVGDWVAFFDRELQAASWRQVLAEWVALLAPGLVGAATHGLIRTGHAARSLGQRENSARRHELAQGLAYWAARYQLLPSGSSVSGPGIKAAEAVRRVERIPADGSGGGSTASALHRLDGVESFRSVLYLIDTSGDPSPILSELTETFAHVYLANSDPPHGRMIIFIHSVTGPSALRLLLPHLTPDAAHTALRYGWQAAAALYAVFGKQAPDHRSGERHVNPEELVQRAIATGDEHAIKFTEACLRENAVHPKPVYLEAAWNAVERLSG